MEVKQRVEEDRLDSRVVKEGTLFRFPLVPVTTCLLSCSSCFNVLFARKKLNNHIIEMHLDPTS